MVTKSLYVARAKKNFIKVKHSIYPLIFNVFGQFFHVLRLNFNKIF